MYLRYGWTIKMALIDDKNNEYALLIKRFKKFIYEEIFRKLKYENNIATDLT